MRRIAVTAFFVAVTVGVVASAAAPRQFVISLATGANDGRTILFHQQEMHLSGIAVPSDGQSGGSESKDSLRSLVVGKEVRCQLDEGVTPEAPDLIATCFVGEIDVGGYQVTKGHARDCPRTSKRRYAAAEVNAQIFGRNLSKVFELPASCQEQ